MRRVLRAEGARACARAASLAALAACATVLLAGCGLAAADRRAASPLPPPPPAARPIRLTPQWTASFPDPSPAGAIPAVADGIVFASAPGPVLRAYRVQTGDLLWLQPLPGGGSTLPGPPLPLGGRVFVLSGDVLAAFDAVSGRPLWQHGVPDLRTASGALQLVDGAVLPPANGLPRYDPATGAPLGALLKDTRLPGSAGTAVVPDGQGVVVLDPSGGATAHAPDGRVLWHATPPPARGPAGQPAAGAFVGLQPGAAGVVVAMEGLHWPCAAGTPSDCRDDGGLQAVGLDLASGRVRWIQPEGTALPLAVDPGSATALEAGTGVAVSLADGRALWRLPGAETAVYSDVAALDSGAFVAWDPMDGSLLEVSASRGRTLAAAHVAIAPGAGLDPRPHLAVGGGYAVVSTDPGTAPGDAARLEAFALPPR